MVAVKNNMTPPVTRLRDIFLRPALMEVSMTATCFWLVLISFVLAVVIAAFIYDVAGTATDNTRLAQNSASCCTQRGQCPLSQPQQTGTRCYCTSSEGPIPGSAC